MRFCFLVVLGISSSLHAEPTDNYWQCVTHDASSKEWTVKNNYKKMALNLAYANCKRESTVPTTCKTTSGTCELFIQGVSVRPMWACTALDRTATPWRSNSYSQRYDAALAAQAYCRQNSTVPMTCYINLVTCTNING